MKSRLKTLVGEAQRPKEVIQLKDQTEVKVTSIKIDAIARDKLKVYKGLSNANNISEAIDFLIKDAYEGLSEPKKKVLLEMLEDKGLQL